MNGLPLAAMAVMIVAGCESRAPAVSAAEPVTVDSESTNWTALYQQGVTFGAFLAAADQRRETWHDNFARAHVPAAVMQRAGAVPGSWRLLVVAEDWCGDSANTIPYLARLVAEVEGLDMRIVDSEVGAAVMAAHRTPDGRPSTPTVVLLDAAGHDAGCWVERPAALQGWFLETEGEVDRKALLDRKYSWYDWDVGVSTVAEVTEVIEAAAAGGVICR